MTALIPLATRRRASRALTAALIVVVGSATADSMRPTVRGIRFNIDTTETNAPATGLFSMFAGRVEFAAGRGRVDVTNVALRPTRSINGGVTVGPLLARPGDYYLFDSSGYILVRPGSRTFSGVSFSESPYRHGNVRASWDGMFHFGPVTTESVSLSDSGRLTQHGPFGVRWHLDRVRLPVADLPLPSPGAEILARGRTLVIDAPRGDASVVRWMGPTAALATLVDSIKSLDTTLQVTAVVVLPAQPGRSSETNLILLHQMWEISVTDVDLARSCWRPTTWKCHGPDSSMHQGYRRCQASSRRTGECRQQALDCGRTVAAVSPNEPYLLLRRINRFARYNQNSPQRRDSINLCGSSCRQVAGQERHRDDRQTCAHENPRNASGGEFCPAPAIASDRLFVSGLHGLYALLR